jgi:hypothetical protein
MTLMMTMRHRSGTSLLLLLLLLLLMHCTAQYPQASTAWARTSLMMRLEW